MNPELKELVSQADRGDQEAQKRLMKMGQEKLAAGECQDAAELFKLAAMAYRIAASFNGSQAAEAQGKLSWTERVLEMYRDWIRKYTTPVESRMKCLAESELPGNRESVFFELYRLRDDTYRPLMLRLTEELERHGVSFSAPGGTLNRHFMGMLWSEQSERKGYEWLADDIDIRVALDPIVDAVLARLGQSGGKGILEDA